MFLLYCFKDYEVYVGNIYNMFWVIYINNNFILSMRVCKISGFYLVINLLE